MFIDLRFRRGGPILRAGLAGVAVGLSLGLGSPVEAAPPSREKASYTLAVDRTSYAPGSQARVAAVVKVEPGWHVNSRTPTYDYLIPTTLSFDLPEGWPEARVEYPPGEMQTFAFADEPLSVYDGEFILRATLKIPEDVAPGRVPVKTRLHYQACDDRQCLPPVTAEATLELAIGPEGNPINQELFSRAGGGPPGPGPGMAAMLVLGILGGLILNAMPCVLPVLSLKVFALVRSAGEGRAGVVLGSLATAAGILLSFWALAGAAVVARAAGAAVGWGVQFQEPAFVTFLAVVVMLFCLNLWGLFEIPLPHWLARVADSGPRQGVAGHFVWGLFATLMATPCSAPFLGTAVGFALSQQALVIFAIFTAVGVGMALPYLALAVAPGAARLLPKPGQWMETLKIAMGFLLAATVVWLLYVLAAQVSPERLAWIELGLLSLALFTWLRHRAAKGPALRGLAAAGLVAGIAVTLWLAAGASGHAGSAMAGESQGLIDWVTFDRQEAEELAAQGRLVFVDVTADWCFTCKVNERLVLETGEVAATFQRHGVIPMKADWTNRDDEIARYLAEFGRYGIPFYLLYRPGAEPHVFSELITKGEIVRMVEASAGAGGEGEVSRLDG